MYVQEKRRKRYGTMKIKGNYEIRTLREKVVVKNNRLGANINYDMLNTGKKEIVSLFQSIDFQR
jgi:hypothetical protein